MIFQPNTWRPDAFHGRKKKADYFEGWYFKLVTADERARLAVIPGVFLGKSEAEHHCFVQTLDGVTGRTSYHRYPLDQFWAHKRNFEIRVGPNSFSAEEIALNIDEDGRRLVGTLRFIDPTPWPVTLTAPGTMGWYALTPFMECYHGVVSLDHAVEGLLAVDGAPVDFHGGRGYTEKDWGEAFPSAWIWFQSNHFARPGISLTASVARIPWLRSSFRGFIVGLWHDDLLYRFATYTGALIERLEVTDASVSLAITGAPLDGDKTAHRLEIMARRNAGGSDLLYAPVRSGMERRVLESLTATVEVRLMRLDLHGEQIVFEGTGRNAGLEVGGNPADVLNE